MVEASQMWQASAAHQNKSLEATGEINLHTISALSKVYRYQSRPVLTSKYDSVERTRAEPSGRYYHTENRRHRAMLVAANKSSDLSLSRKSLV